MPETKERAEQDKARHRALLASIVAGLQTVVESDEQLLAFARGRLAGGWRGKLTIGPEAFFAPFVNIGLTDRRSLLQHIHPEDGKPSEILPHAFPLTEILSIHFSDIEMFGKDVAGRLTVHLNNEQHCRIRLQGEGNVDNARALVEVYRSLTVARRATTSPTQSICAHCGHILDQPSKFCPYCGGRRADAEAAPTSPVSETPPPEEPTAPLPPDEIDNRQSEIENPPEPVVDTAWTPAPSAWEMPIAPEPPVAPEPPIPPEPPLMPEPPEAPAPPEAPIMAQEADPELVDEIHRFTEEGGSPPAVEYDDDVPSADEAIQQPSEPAAPSEPPSEPNPPAPQIDGYNMTF